MEKDKQAQAGLHVLVHERFIRLYRRTMSKRRKRNIDDKVRRVADQQLIRVRRKVRQLVKRELRLLQQHFATKSELRRSIDRLERIDLDQARTLADTLDLVDKRFTTIENATSLPR